MPIARTTAASASRCTTHSATVDGDRLIVSTPRPGDEYGPAHSRNPSSGSSRVQASSRRSRSLLKQQLYTSNRWQSSYPCQTPAGQGVVDGGAGDGEGDLHEAVRVHRAVPPVEVAAGVGRHGLGQVEQALAGADRGGLRHLRTVTPPAAPRYIRAS